GAAITLAVGVLFLGVPFQAAGIDWPLLVVVMVLGVISILAIGLTLAAICMQTRQESWSYPEAAAGALFLVCGVGVPLGVLPEIAQAIGLLMPLTWWIEGVRHALFPGGVSGIGGAGSLFQSLTGSAAPTSAEIVVALMVTGAVATLASVAVFRV